MKISPLADSRLAELLLVEDNEDDVFLTRAAFEASGLRVGINPRPDILFREQLREECRRGDVRARLGRSRSVH